MINKKLFLFFLICTLSNTFIRATLKKKAVRNNISKSLYEPLSESFNLAMLSSNKDDDLELQSLINPVEQNIDHKYIDETIPASASNSIIIPEKNEYISPAKEPVQSTAIMPIQSESIPFAFTDNSSDIPLELRSEIKNPDDEMADALQVLNARREESIEFHFENAGLDTLISQIEAIFNITFITDDVIIPETGKTAKATLKGNKITFKTHKPLNKDGAWSLFTTFLDISKFAIVPMGEKNIYRIQPVAQAERSAIRSFIGVDSEELPASDEIIRYVYFIKNSTVEAITSIVKTLKSAAAPMIELKEHKAFLLTDKAYNIRVLMQIVKELDQTTRPQSMSVLKLQRSDAQKVKELYESLINPDQQAAKTRVFRPQQKQSSLYFPEDMKIIAERRTNTLILLGPQDAIKKVEEFIIKYVDIDLEQPYSPLHVIELKYANAAAIADILREVTKFGDSNPAAKASGGVRGGDKFLKKMSFVAEENTNRLIVRGDYEDFLQVKEIVEKLDAQQAQVAIEILILDMADSEKKQLGAQIRSKVPGTDSILGNNVQFQTSGLFAGSSTGAGIVENTNSNLGATKLLGNLISLVTGNGAGAGNTIINLGHDAFGVWGIFQMLQTITNVHVISNPFLMATNKTEAVVKLGTTRRVVTSVVQGNTPISGQGDQEATLTVTITPQINSDGMITLDYNIDIVDFTNPTNPTDAATAVKKIKSKAVVADQEILALGGLVRNQFNVNMSKTPILGDIPVLGWFFKNKNKAVQKQNLLILVSTRIIPAGEVVNNTFDPFSEERYKKLQYMNNTEMSASDKRDPIHHMFFEHKKSDSLIEDFIFERGRETSSKRKSRQARLRTKKQKHMQQKKQSHETTKKSLQKLPAIKSKDEINNSFENQKPIMVQQSINIPTPSLQTEVRV